MAKKAKPSELGKRQRQILDIIYELGEASVGDVLERLSDPPSYSSVRTMIRVLESKKLLKHRNEGNKYFYKPTHKREVVRKSALAHLMKTFFSGSETDTIAAILDNSDGLSKEELDRLEQIIELARKDGK